MGVTVSSNPSHNHVSKLDLQYSFKRDISESERQSLLKSWAKVRDSTGLLGLQMVLKIVSMDPSIRNLFGFNTDDAEKLTHDGKVAAHSKVFEKFVDTIVCNIGEDFLLPYLKKVGSEHFYKLGPQVTESMWQQFAEAMLSVIIAKIPRLDQLQHRNAWRKVFLTIAHHMKLGYEEAFIEYRTKYG